MSDHTEQQEAPPITQEQQQLSLEREQLGIRRQQAMAETTLGGPIGVFSNGDAFKLACAMADRIAASSIVPKEYIGNPNNVLIAIDLAARMRVSPIMLMQNMDIVFGRPGLRGTFYAGLINNSGLFAERLKYEWRGEERTESGPPSPDYGCRAWTTDSDGVRINGAWIDWTLVLAEGWQLDKPGRNGNPAQKSKWNTMREQMFMYRAAAFFGRAHASDVTLGMQTSEELRDVIEGEYERVSPPETLADKLNQRTSAEPADSGKAAGKATRRRTKFTREEPVFVDEDVVNPPIDSDDAPPFAEDVPQDVPRDDLQAEQEATNDDAGETARAASANFNLE